MTSLCLYFQVHAPCRLRHYTFFDIDQSHAYADEAATRTAVRRSAERLCLPACAQLLHLIREYAGDFRVAFSISGMALDAWRTRGTWNS